MKPWHWIIALIALYELSIGVSEILNSNGIITSSFASWPSVGTYVFPSVAGAVDVVTALLLYFAVLHEPIWRV